MQLGKFDILEELGRGGFGTVYKAVDLVLDRHVAIKVLHPNLVNDPAFLGRFRQEAQIAAKLDHPNLVPVYDYGENEGRYYIVMGYMAGGSLKDLMKKEGPLSKERAFDILQQIGEGLAFAHQKGIIHRDLKPGNILFDNEGKARISDMGFAKLIHSDDSMSMSTSGGLVGTPAYIAPEIWNGKPAIAATDIYSLTCILVEMFTGKPLFDGETTPMVMMKHFQPLQLPEDLPEEWVAVIEKGLAKQTEDRFSSVSEFISNLQSAEVRSTRVIEEEGDEIDSNLVESENEMHVNESQPRITETHVRTEKPKPVSGIGHFKSAEPGMTSTRESSSGDNRKLPGILKNGIYLGLTALIVLIIILIIRPNAFSTDPETAERPLVNQPQETSAKLPEPTDTKTAIPTKTVAPTTKPSATLSPTPTLGIGSTLTREKDRMEMVYVPEGSFSMGSFGGEDDQKPVHKVNLDAYWIDKHLVTNGQYALCVIEGACTEPDDSSSYTRSHYFGVESYANYPVIYVSWNQAQDYCQWAGAKLPTEAEWEKAARGINSFEYPWGNQLPNSILANWNQNEGDTTEVGSFPDGASPYGVLDMAGNVWEWVQDWYRAYHSGEVSNPTGPVNGDYKVLRGGGWIGTVIGLRTSYRHYRNPGFTKYDIGFRCASTP